MTNDRLAAAHRRVAETTAHLDIVTQAAEAARAYVVEVEAEVAVHVRKNEDASVKRAAALAQSLKLGKSATFAETPYIAVDNAARRASEEQLAVARRALGELVTEQNEAQAVLDKDTEALHEAAAAS
jgi:hypothetical protein